MRPPLMAALLTKTSQLTDGLGCGGRLPAASAVARADPDVMAGSH